MAQATSAASALKGMPGSDTLVKLLSNPATASLALPQVGKAATSLPRSSLSKATGSARSTTDIRDIGTNPQTDLPQKGFIQPSNLTVTPYASPTGCGSLGAPRDRFDA